ncbi:conserved hypothetical protein [Clostridium neonatale]|nr:conserved hypothetical protein [Clostridium neonatale]CAI3656349.1 conserved hypothetical protein [Clostridium neonatale]CAI3705178.1 conserved hypothetical protein [Clostridium neonatale]CAI3713605.1 conserved hypothetical protein [Clostridium neonatale]
MIQEDVENVFMNNEEFSDIHLIDGKEMSVMIDENENMERKVLANQNMEGIFKKQKLIYGNAKEFGVLPARGRIINLDCKNYTVVDAVDEYGIYTLTLEANRSGNNRGK